MVGVVSSSVAPLPPCSTLNFPHRDQETRKMSKSTRLALRQHLRLISRREFLDLIARLAPPENNQSNGQAD